MYVYIFCRKFKYSHLSTKATRMSRFRYISEYWYFYLMTLRPNFTNFTFEVHFDLSFFFYRSSIN